MRKLQKHHANLLQLYGNVAYQEISGDVFFENVPEKLNEAWYSEDTISFRTIATSINSEKDLIKLESELLALEYVLKDEFKKLIDTGE
ncbi:MAG: hypothetical protein GX670_07800 [Bacteroidales bacterium]|nr:hypothetical protein [Bacteroidales bacterium]